MASRSQPMLWRNSIQAGARRSAALLGGAALALMIVLMAVALVSYHPSDVSFNTASGQAAANRLGSPGAYFADLMFTLAGIPGVLILPLGLLIAWRLWRDVPLGHWGRALRDCVIGIALMAGALAFLSRAALEILPAGWGGVVGYSIAGGLGALIDILNNPTVIIWTKRVIGVAIGLGGIALWARGMSIDLGEARRAIPDLRRRLAGEPAKASDSLGLMPRAVRA